MATDMDPIRRRGNRWAHTIGTKLDLTDPSHLTSLRDAYLVAYQYHAPLMVRVADDMLADLRADVGSRRADRLLALGRDGHHLALAMKMLDRNFMQQNSSNLVVSRALVENAVQDLENHHGMTFPQVAAFRRVASRVDRADTAGGFWVLSEYLQTGGVPVGQPGSRVSVFDTSFKGTVQELLSAVYPETTFTGRYAFHGESPHDPHPGSKKGYEVHLAATEGRGGLPLYELPDDVSKTFAHQLAINSIEELFDGPMSSPVRLGAAGPEQTGQRHDPALLDGLSRGRISARFRHLPVREGVKAINLYAIGDLAGDVARVRDAGGNYRAWLDDRAQRYRTEIRAWISGGSTDPRLAEILDSFVHRADKKQADLLQKALDRAQVPEAARESIWSAYEQCGSDGDKTVFVENVLNSTRASGGRDGRREGKRPGGRLDGPGRDDRGL
ncbi:ABC transporter permease [Kribbella speibonae]|uniref:ABC transporter permease n=1 Tax=Kribbella speibonae TaxID=1572660 RepID=A0A4R0IJE9_9ACTN|nr:ABC transporter permease [Kribbella speibonae]TCC32817.1 ABC transporter permease [Kribbella speibonae]